MMIISITTMMVMAVRCCWWVPVNMRMVIIVFDNVADSIMET